MKHSPHVSSPFFASFLFSSLCFLSLSLARALSPTHIPTIIVCNDFSSFTSAKCKVFVHNVFSFSLSCVFFCLLLHHSFQDQFNVELEFVTTASNGFCSILYGNTTHFFCSIFSRIPHRTYHFSLQLHLMNPPLNWLVTTKAFYQIGEKCSCQKRSEWIERKKNPYWLFLCVKKNKHVLTRSLTFSRSPPVFRS